MEPTLNDNKYSRLQTIDRLRRNYTFMKFSLLPELADFKNDLRWMADKTDISIEMAFNFQEELISSKIWKLNSDQVIENSEKFVNFFPESDPNSKVLGFLTTNAILASKISHDGPNWFEYSTVVTTEEFRTEFIKKINSVYQEFLQKSLSVKGTEVVSWSHMFLDAFNNQTNIGEKQ